MSDIKCPFLEIETVTFCKAFPVKKMIPAEKGSQGRGVCYTEGFHQCMVYQDIHHSHAREENIRGFRLRKDMYIHPGHSWMSLPQDGESRVGIDDFSQKLIGRIDSVAFPSEGSFLRENRSCFMVRSGRRMARITAPVDGVIKRVNQEVLANPQVINSDPYDAGWIFTMEPHGEGMQGLFYGQSARRWLQREVDLLQRVFVHDLGLTATDGGVVDPAVFQGLTEAQWGRVVSLFLG